VVTAAVRELFEESGVLLAGDTRQRHVAALDGPGWARDRERLVAHRASLGEVLAERGLVLRSDLLGVRGHWLTPEFEPRRYDTYFFTALVPPGQRADGRTSEAVSHRWLRPSEALQSAACGEVALLPPTAYCMAQLTGCDSLEQFSRERLRVERMMFVPTVDHDDTVTLSCRLPSPGAAVRGVRDQHATREAIECASSTADAVVGASTLLHLDRIN
jgi:8-oxo-dGTP pyrophosphatase MutT (NUDIX family)